MACRTPFDLLFINNARSFGVTENTPPEDTLNLAFEVRTAEATS